MVWKGLLLLVSSYLSKLLFAAATFLIVRHFDVAAYGTYATAFTFVSFFAVFLNFGINDLMVREVAVHPGSAPDYLGDNVLISLCVSVAVYIAMLLTGRTLLPDGAASGLVFVLGLAVIVQSLQQIFWSLLQVNRRVDLAGLGQAFFAVFWVSSVLIVVVFKMGLRQLVVLQLLTAVLGLGAYLLISAPFIKMRPNTGRVPGMLRQVYPFGLSNLFAFVYIQADILLVSRITGEYAAGLYAAVLRLLLLVLVIPEMVYKTILPLLYGVTAHDTDRARNLYRHGIILMLLVMAPFAFVYLLWPGPVITLLLGQGYAGAAPVLRIFSAVIIIQALIHPAGQQLVALGRQHLRYKLQLAVTAVFLLASLACIPRYGIYGAALVNAGGRLLLLILYMAALARQGFPLPRFRECGAALMLYALLAVTGLALLRTGAAVWIAAPLMAAVTGAFLLAVRHRIPAFRELFGA